MNQNYNVPSFIVDLTGIGPSDSEAMTSAIKAQFYEQMPTAKEALLFVMHGFNMLLFQATEGGFAYSLFQPESVSYVFTGRQTNITFTLAVGQEALIIGLFYDINGRPIIDIGGIPGEGGV